MTSPLNSSSWECLLSFLNMAFPDGIPISELFDAVNAFPAYTQDINGLNELWQAVLQRDDILFAPNDEKLSESSLKDFTYEQLRSLDLGKKLIRLREAIHPESTVGDSMMWNGKEFVPRRQPSSAAPSLPPSNARQENPSSPAMQVDDIPHRPWTTENCPPVPEDASPQASISYAPHRLSPAPGASHTETTPTPAPNRRGGRRPKNESAASSSIPTGQTQCSGDREAVFTSQDQLNYKAGVPGIYVNLPGTENPNVKRTKKALTSVVVFKSPILKNPEHLSINRGSWAPYVAELLQKDVEQIKKNTQKPKRNPNPKKYNRKPKPQALSHPQPSVLQDPETGAWNFPSISHLVVPEPKPAIDSTIDVAITPLGTPSESTIPRTKRKYTKRKSQLSRLSLPPISDPPDPAIHAAPPPQVSGALGSYVQWGTSQASSPSGPSGYDYQPSPSVRDTSPSGIPLHRSAALASPPSTSSLGGSSRHHNRSLFAESKGGLDSQIRDTMPNGHSAFNPHTQNGNHHAQEQNLSTSSLEPSGDPQAASHYMLGSENTGQKPSYSSPYATSTASKTRIHDLQAADPSPSFYTNSPHTVSQSPYMQQNPAPITSLSETASCSRHSSISSQQMSQGNLVHNMSPSWKAAQQTSYGNSVHDLNHPLHGAPGAPHQNRNFEAMEGVKFIAGHLGNSRGSLQAGETSDVVGSGPVNFASSQYQQPGGYAVPNDQRQSSLGHAHQSPSPSYHSYSEPPQEAPPHFLYDQRSELKPSPYRQLQPLPTFNSNPGSVQAHTSQTPQRGESVHLEGTPWESAGTVNTPQATQPQLVQSPGTSSEPTRDHLSTESEASLKVGIAMSPPVQDSAAEEMTPKRAGLRKRKKPSTPVDDDFYEEIPEPKFRKTRKGKTPGQSGSTEATPRKSSRLSATEVELENSLIVAEECPIPIDFTRLACVFEHKYVGNLILSKDFSLLEFYWTGQHPPEAPTLSLPVIEITEEPITSVRGSKSMQLKIKAVYQNDDGFVTHSFIYGSSPARAEAAANMRSKIIIAMAAEKLRAGVNYVRPSEVREGIVKPFLCEKCGARFKNINGLQYHQTKAKTACNPDFDITQLQVKIKRGPKPKAKEVVEDSEPEFVGDDEGADEFDPSKTRKSRRKRKTKKPAKTTEPEIVEDDEDAANAGEESEDSVMEWARKTAGVTDEPKSSTPGRLYKAFNRETQISKEILKAFHESTESEDQALELPAPPSLFTTELPTLSDLANQMSSGEALTETICKEMILAVVHANNDILPGEKSIWVACVALWLKKHPKSNVMPRSTLCYKCTDDLLSKGTLQSEPFDYMGLRSRKLVGTLIFTPGADLASEGCRMLKSLVEECTPRIYVPFHLAPTPGLFDGLQALAGRLIPNPNPPPKKVVEDEDVAEFDMSSPENIYYDEDSTGDEFQAEEEAEEEVEEEAEEDGDAMDLDVDVDDVSNPLGSKKPQKAARRHKSSSAPFKRHRDPATNAKIKETISQRWVDIRAGKIPRPDNSKRQQKKNQAKAYSLQLWDTAPAFMPNHETGAWDVPAPTTHGDQQSRKGYRSRIPFIPEPITYLQEMDGSWSVRAFGHGVKPIYSRPARRADGNPNLAAYLKRIEEGHRPIVFPEYSIPQHNEEYAMDSPAKRVTRKLKANEMSPDVVGSPEFDLEADSAPRRKRKYVWKDAVVKSGNSTAIMPRGMQKLKPDAPLNPGLETIPNYFGLGALTSVDDLKIMDFSQKYINVKFTEQKYMGEVDEGRGEYSWTFGSHELAREPYQLQWSDDLAFDLQTLPYNDLRDESEDEIPQAKKVAAPVALLPTPRRAKAKGPSKYISVAEKALRKERSEKTRQQIALTTDIIPLGKDPAKMAARFNVEITEPNEAARKRKRHSTTTMSQADENKFIIAVIVQRTLTGGKESYIDWALISTLFQNHSMSFLLHYWRDICEGKKDILEKITQDFRSAYPNAYQKGLVPKFNWDKLLDNDWEGLIRWAQANIVTPFGNSNDVVLPTTRQEVEQQYDMTEVDVDDDWSDTYYSLGAAKFKKVEASSTLPKAVALTKPYSSYVDEEQAEAERCARSWARAVCLTPDVDWDAAPISVRNKIKRFPDKVATRAFDSLFTGKVLVHRNKGRPLPGRSYEGTDAFYATLRRHMKEPQFLEAVTYKRWMDAEFRSGTPCLMVDYMGNEGSVIVLTSLQAKGRIRIESRNVPRQKFGLTEEGYETKSIPREKLTFEMTITPTSTYIFDDDNEILTSIFNSVPPKDDKGKIPVWYGISEILIPDMWKRVIIAVSQIMALRAGINLDGLLSVFKPTMEKWELVLLVDWGVEVGLFERIHERIEGWIVSEWWWAVAGRLCGMYDELVV